MIKELKIKLLVLAAVVSAGVCSLNASGGWSHYTTSGSWSAYVSVPACTGIQMIYSYGGSGPEGNQWGCCVINSGPLGYLYTQRGDDQQMLNGPVSAGTHYIYQYVLVLQVPITGGESLTVFHW